jgi:hypothetical protein
LRIEWALACREAEGDGGVADVKGAGIDTLWIESFPSEAALLVLARLAAHEIECGAGTPHRIEGYLLGPGMTVLETLDFEIALEARPDHPPGYEVTTLLPLVVVFQAEQEGLHGLELRINNKFQWLVPFTIYEGEPPPAVET